MIQKNPGYDIVFYPQYEIKKIKPAGLGFFYKKVEVKVTGRLCKIK